MIHSDIPTRPQIDQLLNVRHPASVSLYLPTGRSTLQAQQDRVVLSNLRELVRSKLAAVGADAEDVAALEERIEAIADDDDFWTRQADSLAVFNWPRVPSRRFDCRTGWANPSRCPIGSMSGRSCGRSRSRRPLMCSPCRRARFDCARSALTAP